MTSRWSRARRRGGRPRVAVVCFDVERNGFQRAWILADLLRDAYEVELVGASFTGSRPAVWPPLRGTDVKVRAFRGHKSLKHVAVMERVASKLRPDAVVVSRPRLPSLGLALLIKEATGVPVIADVDDLDTAFLDDTDAAELATLVRQTDRKGVDRVGSGTWAAACEARVGAADAVTVSSRPLQERYGGTVIPQARDERRFDPAIIDRARSRRRLGLAGGDRAVMFAGTPRPHKGIDRVLDALREIGDPRNKLVVVGTPRGGVAPWFETLDPASITLVPDQPFERMPEVLAAADLVCLLQDPANEVSAFQMPTKLTDALAMGVPVLASRVPPLQQLSDDGVITTLGDEPVAPALAEALEQSAHAGVPRDELRAVFLDTLSYRAVRPVLNEVVERARAQADGTLAPDWRELLDAVREATQLRHGS